MSEYTTHKYFSLQVKLTNVISSLHVTTVQPLLNGHQQEFANGRLIEVKTIEKPSSDFDHWPPNSGGHLIGSC